MYRYAFAFLLFTLVAVTTADVASPDPIDEPAAGGEADAEAIRTRENLANLLNHAQVSIHVIGAFNNRAILDREYQTIINNLRLTEIPDQRVIDLLLSLMDSLTGATLTDRDRQQIERLHLKRVKNSSRDLAKRSIEAGLGTGLEISAAVASKGSSLAKTKGQSLGPLVEVGMAYWDYQSLIDEMQAEKEEQAWEIDGEVLKKINEINKQMLALSWGLYTDYEVPEKWRLVPETIRELTEMNRERDLEKRLRMLDRPYMREQFSRFAPYWFYLGSTAQQLYLKTGDANSRSRALDAYNHYEQTRSPILKKDEMFASVSLGRAQLMDPEKQKSEIMEQLEIIERAPPSNSLTISAMALLYAQIDEHRKAREWAQHNIDRASGDATLHQQVMASVLASSGNRRALRQLVARLVAGSTAQTFEILDMVGPLDSTQVANSLRPHLLAVRPTLEERTMRSDHILFEIPLVLEAEMKELTLLSGGPIYDPRTGLRTVNAEGRHPDEVTRSENGKQTTFRFDGVFDADDWEEHGQTHVLFVLQEGTRSISLLYEIVAQPDSEPAYRFELDQIAIDDVQFRETSGAFVAAGPLLKKEFDSSLAGLTYALSLRYEIESDAGPIEISAIAAAADEKRDARSLRELVRRMKDDPDMSYLDIIEIAQVQSNPRATLEALPFAELQMSHEENLLGSTYSLGSSALSYVGAGDYGEGREDLVLRLPSKWLGGGETAAPTHLVIAGEEIEGDEPALDEEASAYIIRFGSGYHAEQWKDQKVDRISVRFDSEDEPKLVLHYQVTAEDDASDTTLSLETIEMGDTRFAASR